MLLISLAVGLAAGFGRWDLALILTVFALLVLGLLEYREAYQVSRAMDVKVASKNVSVTQGILREIFSSHGFDSKLRGINRESSDELMGSLVYSVDISPIVTTDALPLVDYPNTALIRPVWQRLLAAGAGDEGSRKLAA